MLGTNLDPYKKVCWVRDPTPRGPVRRPGGDTLIGTLVESLRSDHSVTLIRAVQGYPTPNTGHLLL